MGRTLVQVTLGQLTAISLQPLDDTKTRVRVLRLMGKYFKLLALREDALCVWTLWEQQADEVRENVLLHCTEQSPTTKPTVRVIDVVGFFPFQCLYPNHQLRITVYIQDEMSYSSS